MQRIKDLEFDLEKTRQWAVQAEKENYEMKKQLLELQKYNDYKAKIEELTKAVQELQEHNASWQECYTDLVTQLNEAKSKINDDSNYIMQLIQERNALYESLD